MFKCLIKIPGLSNIKENEISDQEAKDVITDLSKNNPIQDETRRNTPDQGSRS